ncbi:transmembrane channel-like protein 1 [Tetranychus urticae]|uniref:transmembrane channel-like protein 1 n=1 Tax=Tetranychus urticae TaxID=32264 RepID=UPI00077C0AC7|nr:transmembrane channel-like protein 1 [Tetranychus urticae]
MDEDKVALTKEDSVIQEDRENNDDVGETRSESNEDESVKNGENSNVQQIRRGLTRSRSNYPESSASSTVDQDDEHGQDSEATISTSPSHHGDASEDKQSKVKNGNVSEDHKPPTSSPSPSPSLHSASTSPLPSPCQSPPSLSEKIRDRRRSSLAPRDSELITVTKRSRSGSRSPRRGSTTFLMGDDSIMVQLETGKRRLSSFCASSNDETMITIDDSLTEEEIVETLKAHKQIISNIKTQNWPMHRKLKILRRAKMYIKKHEGDLKQSKQAKDIVTKYRTYLEKSINRLKREIDNLVVQLTPWEMRIKKIESQFGSVVASYFTFLRWIFWINTFTSISMIVFLMVPEILRSNKDPTQMRKFEDANKNLTFKEMINTAWNFDGYLKYSPIFYGYYDNEETTSIGYRLPLVYFGVCLLLYAFSFFCILHKMTQNARNNRIGSKDDEYVFTWKLFTGWDFMIGNSETAYNKVASIVMGFKEVILEEKEKKKEEKNWKMIVRRVIANILVLLLLISSAYAVVFVVQRSLKLPENPGFIRENEVTIVISGIQTVYPNIFNIIAALEDYHPRIALRWQLARILVLNLLNLYAFLLATFDKIDEMSEKLLNYKKLIKGNVTALRLSTTIAPNIESDTITLRVIDSLKPRENGTIKRNRRQPHEGRLYPPEDFKITRGDVEFIMTTESTTYDPYARNDLDAEEPIDGRYLSGFTSPPTSTTLGNSSNGDPGGGSTLDPDSENGTITITLEETESTPPSNGSDDGLSVTTPSAFSVKQSTMKGYSSSRPSQWINGSFVTDSLPTSTPSSRTNKSTRPVTSRPSTKGVTRLPTTKVTVSSTVKQSGSASGTTTVRPYFETTTQCLPETTTIFTYTADEILQLSETERTSLRDLCWETMFGQELAKILVADTLLGIVITIVADYGRALFVRYCNDCSCIFWDLETQFPGYSDFQIAENILSLVNNQANIWLGMFFSPGLPGINTIRLCILMYLQSWAVLTSNIPHETVFKASGNNNFYYAILLSMLFICILPVGYAVVWLEPSWHCGPFSGYHRVYHVLTKYLEKTLPDRVNKIIDYLTSPGAVIPLILLMILIIYYLMSSVGSLREANNDLKSQLRKEKDLQEEEDEAAAAAATGATVGQDVAGNCPQIINTIDGILTPGMEKKHVRINDDIGNDSDVAKLLDSS